MELEIEIIKDKVILTPKEKSHVYDVSGTLGKYYFTTKTSNYRVNKKSVQLLTEEMKYLIKILKIDELFRVEIYYENFLIHSFFENEIGDCWGNIALPQQSVEKLFTNYGKVVVTYNLYEENFMYKFGNNEYNFRFVVYRDDDEEYTGSILLCETKMIL